MDDPVQGRRERVRLETSAEIKQRAWALMADVGPYALSLREVARQMGMAPSALYRYFASRDDLLTALIVDGFTSLAEAIEGAYAREHAKREVPPADAVFLTVAKAYRRWAFDHRTEFALIFSTSIPDYNGTAETKLAAMRSSALLLRVMADVVAEGLLDRERIATELTPGLRVRLRRWGGTGQTVLPEEALAAAMWCYAALHGAIHLDMNGHLPEAMQHQDALFESTMRAITLGMMRRQ